MGKYRLLFILVSGLFWGGILYAVSTVRPELLTELFEKENIIKADKDEVKKPPPPPPPPPEKLPPPPPLQDRQIVLDVDIPPPPREDLTNFTPDPPAVPIPDPIQSPPPPPVDTRSCLTTPGAVDGPTSFTGDYPDNGGGAEGTVRGTLSVSASGSVTDVSIDSSVSPAIDAAFRSQARGLRFSPATLRCDPVAGTIQVSARFTAPAPRCSERDQPPRPSRPFNVERAYPQRLLERETEGEVSATVRVGADGGVTDVIITGSTPPGAFDSAVDREVRRMRFSPARADCQDAAGEYQLRVQFRINE